MIDNVDLNSIVFANNDTHLRLPYQVVDLSRNVPDPFQDADAFSTAYAVAFPANPRGIMLSEARAMVKNKTWRRGGAGAGSSTSRDGAYAPSPLT
jgi:hypothetical protein